MYAGSLDVPEIATLRRVKALPKRRRTSAHAPLSMASPLNAAAGVARSLMNDVETAADGLLAPQSVEIFQTAQASPPRLHADSHNEEEELVGHTDRMALQSYYLQEFLAAAASNGAGTHATSTEFLYGPGYQEDEEEGSDYVNHLQQPGNTKKRKVPANLTASQREDEGSDQTQEEVRLDEDDSDRHHVVPRPYHGKMRAATLAGLQHKAMLRTRKRQLAAVLGALSDGDTLALDQALSTTSYVDTEHHPAKIRLSKRKVVRMARAAKTTNERERRGFPASEFTFVCPSATADRLIATKEEVRVLRSKFEQEMARQAEQLAAANKAAGCEQTRTAKASKGKKGRTKPEAVIAQASKSSSQGKKKKGFESNPHHYVPSQGISPLAARFLTAQLPPRRESSTTTTTPLLDPADEWICVFCEYDLFYYGDLGRGVKNRKKILKRRRRARERAAAAASGRGASNVAAKRPERVRAEAIAPVVVDNSDEGLG